MNSGDTAFMLICTAFVFFMTPGLAFFYGGLVRRKNVCNTMMACVSIMGLSVVMWTLFGYSLAFGGNHGGIIGDLRWIGLNHVGMKPGPYADTIPHLVFCAFQMMFAMITPALITGSLVGRMKFKALFIFVAIWSVIVYYPMAHMVWGEGGLLAAMGSVDFAGGDVVHISSGVSALVLAIILGRRRGYEVTTYRIHNIPFVVLGASLLWFGWFGFNAGSSLKADGLAAHAFMTSAISAASALLSWMLIDTVISKKTTLVGASTGLVVGLVAITPGAGFVPIWASFIIGALVSPICYFGVALIKKKLKIDAFIREEKFEDVKAALNSIGVNGMTVSQVMGCGIQRGYKEVVRGMQVDMQMQPKIKFEIVVSSEEWEEKTINAIQEAAFTGETGDGKIFSYEIRTAQKIRTKETGYDAIQATE